MEWDDEQSVGKNTVARLCWSSKPFAKCFDGIVVTGDLSVALAVGEQRQL